MWHRCLEVNLDRLWCWGNMKKKTIMTIFGTRPEAIKMAPIIKEIEKDVRFESCVVVTAQHREMLDQVLETFAIKTDYDLNIMTPNQTLAAITSRSIALLDEVFDQVNLIWCWFMGIRQRLLRQHSRLFIIKYLLVTLKLV